MENFLLVGNGAREHSIAEAVCRGGNARLFAFMSANNPGIARLARESDGKYGIGDIHSSSQVVSFAKQYGITLAFPSPDAVLAAGITDALQAQGILCASPTLEAARLEWDKSYCRDLLRDYKVPGSPAFGIFENAQEASQFIDSLQGSVAVKPAGLTGGKGVKVVGYQLKDGAEAKEYSRDLLATRHGGLNSIVVEEKLEGEEFSLQAFSDGSKVHGMPMVQDHKRAYENDVGPNTGGMGSYSGTGNLLPFTRQKHYEEALGIMQKTIEAFRKKTGNKFVGILYGGFMLTREGPKLLEYNARFGDPESMNVLALLKDDLAEILSQMAAGKIGKSPLFEKKATVCKYLAPEGYPGKALTNQPLQINSQAIGSFGAKAYYAAVYEEDGIIYTQSSRSIALVGMADTISDAERIAEGACGSVIGKVWHRKDIGTDALVKRRVDHMKALGVL
ncbi:TPA: phosphoribosylamine--glycine ligase [Candidatus Micrarchaeota archaeon]|nr:phosphoribosylamine--glycine ligase [Candidatus Micrarchaeota archaeon]HIH30093.1 phosphoribosylamine--glycine ligase [Candidatus Micrarchaeota archaeon]